jgi:hypothetical protein
MTLRLLTLAVLLWCPGVWAASHPDDIKNHYSDEVMKNSCSKTEQRRLQHEVISLAGINNPTQAWTVVQEMLCGVTAKSKPYVISHTATRITDEDNTADPQGESVKREVEGRSIQPIQGHAWDAHIATDNDLIRVIFDYGGVCVGSFDIRYDSSAWNIVATSTYCD